MQPPVPAPRGLRRAVVLTLKPGWTFDASTRQFAGPKQESCTPGGLPPRTRVTPLVSGLAERPARARSRAARAQRDLQRYVHLVLPPGHDPEAYLEAVRAWPCAESAVAAPEISLPASAPPPRQPR